MNSLINLSGVEIISIFFKLFAGLFSLMFFVYAVVVSRQIQTMAKTIQVSDNGPIKRESFIIFFTNLQIFVSLILIIFSIFIIIS